MICQLCKKERKLIRQSHIIPDFMYKGLFNDKHFIAKFNLTGKCDTKLYPNGYYDSDILCENCDNILIGRLESYAKIVLFGGKRKRSNFHEIEQEVDIWSNKMLHVRNVDYKRFKLFLLSVLWKASISKQDIFKHVELGCHEEIIRKMILDSNPGNENEYPIGIFLLTPNDICPTNFITSPFPVGDFDNLSYIFTINGMLINFKIFGEGYMDIYNRLMIRENNTMEVLVLNKEFTVDFLDKIMKGKFRYFDK